MRNTAENLSESRIPNEMTTAEARQQLEQQIAHYVHEYDEIEGVELLLRIAVNTLQDPEALQVYVDEYNRIARLDQTLTETTTDQIVGE